MSLFFRWIRSPTSLLYDPAVEQAVFTMMRKLCLLLVTELNQLGARVAHCSFSKIVLCTNRSDFQSAKTFVTTLRASLRKKKLFGSLNLIPIRYSRAMIWMNTSNKAYVPIYDALTETINEDVSNHFSYIENLIFRTTKPKSRCNCLEFYWKQVIVVAFSITSSICI